MTINTKFSIGDEVWFIKNNKPTKMVITDFSLTADKNGQSVIYYQNGLGKCEYDLFTKQDLLKSLE